MIIALKIAARTESAIIKLLSALPRKIRIISAGRQAATNAARDKRASNLTDLWKQPGTSQAPAIAQFHRMLMRVGAA